MTTPMDALPLWQATLAPQHDSLDAQREVLRQSFLSFRLRVADLVSTLGSELPNLTVHDITHLDALWRVAGEIAGPEYPINPAEAYVLGGAFLLHDAAHVIAAYPQGIAEIKRTIEWKDLIAQKYGGIDPAMGSAAEKFALFQVLRHLHAEQARQLPKLAWRSKADQSSVHLIENHDLRNYYGDLIGEIASSHHWSPQRVAQHLRTREVACPAFLAPANWTVDALKIALLLRTADAAHLDADRAPWFLFVLRQPEGISSDHWRYQAKLGQPRRTKTGELQFSSGSSFTASERSAWWLAFDTAKMVDRELKSAIEIMSEERRPLFSAHRVLGAESAELFCRQIPTLGWEPVDVLPKISNVPSLIERLGGSALYGETLTAPLRELLQNSLDAVNALRSLGGLSADEGEVFVEIAQDGNSGWWLSISDTGIGMSRYVLSNVLLDFGTSLWGSETMRNELPSLASSGFQSVGKFGIGFFSVFMLGREVVVTTRRFEPTSDEAKVNWQLRFDGGLSERPALLEPQKPEALSRHGTRVAVRICDKTLKQLLRPLEINRLLDDNESDEPEDPKLLGAHRSNRLKELLAFLCPASKVTITSRFNSHEKIIAVNPNDWKTLTEAEIHARLKSKQTVLKPLFSDKNEIIGRAGLANKKYRGKPDGSLVFEGVMAGHIRTLSGIMLARENNLDARRVNALPAGDLQDWIKWAESHLKEAKHLSQDNLLALHPLVPKSDLSVWWSRGSHGTLKQMIAMHTDETEILLHMGNIEHDDDDAIASGIFNDSFTPAPNLICCPMFHRSSSVWEFDAPEAAADREFPWFLGVKTISYWSVFEAELRRIWGDFDETNVYVTVGDVEGINVVRDVTRYSRPEI